MLYNEPDALILSPMPAPRGDTMGGETRMTEHIVLRHAIQDGGVFYREQASDGSCLEEKIAAIDCVIANYSAMVRGDHDMAGAKRARERFAKEHPEFVSFVVGF